MKTLIINGSPRKKGDTVALLDELKKHLNGEIIEIFAYKNNISPCIDCRYCWKEGICAIQDDMQIIYNDDYDNIVIASPIYMSGLTGPLISLASRLQVYYASKRFLKKEIKVSPKKGLLILVGGGSGEPDYAIKVAKWMFKQLGATYNKEFLILSLNTDNISASQDKEAMKKIREVATKLN